MSESRDWNKDKSKPTVYEGAPRGMVKNAPHNNLPQGAIAYLKNAHVFPTEWQPRNGSWIYTDVQPPILLDDNYIERGGYTAYKTGNIITVVGQTPFVENDVSNFFVWPGELSNYHDEIQEYVSTSQVRVRDSGDRNSTSGCWLHAKLNLWAWHKAARKVVRQWGTDVYVADNINLSRWTKALCLSYDEPNNAISDWSEMDGYLVIGNSNGTFLLDFSVDPAHLFKKNTTVPSVLPESSVRTNDTKHRYDYLYSMSKITGTGIRNRITAGALIVQESGTCALNTNTNPARDYGINWIDKKIDEGILTQGRLVCGEVAAIYQTPTYWTNQNEATFQLTVNGVTENFLIDFSATGIDVKTMQGVASAIQETIRVAFPFATCEYSEGQFVFTSGEQSGSTIGYGEAGVGGTNHAVIMQMTEATADSLDNTYAFSDVHPVGRLYVPKIPVTPTNPEWHWTHYTLYRSEDVGPSGVEPRTNEATWEDLPPLRLTWVGDYRIGAAFYASKDSSGLITAVIGEFEKADEGTPFEWEDGDIDTLYDYIDSTHIMGTPATEPVDYYDLEKPLQAASLGGGNVIRASQAGTTVTRIAGGLFVSGDERKTIFWADGSYSIIIQYIDADTVIVHDNIDKETQGITLNCNNRVITDTVSDAKLRNRQGELQTGVLGHRFWREMPNINVLEIVPGFMLTARRDASDIYYCQLGTSLKYLSGYYLNNRQHIDRVEDNIRTIKKMPNMFIVFCAQSTWGGPTNNPTIQELPEFGEYYSTIYLDVLDNEIGVVDIGSIQEIDFGLYGMRCSDNSWRRFKGSKYSDYDETIDPDTGQDRVKDDFEDSQSLGASIYGPRIGYIWWGRNG